MCSDCGEQISGPYYTLEDNEVVCAKDFKVKYLCFLYVYTFFMFIPGNYVYTCEFLETTWKL